MEYHLAFISILIGVCFTTASVFAKAIRDVGPPEALLSEVLGPSISISEETLQQHEEDDSTIDSRGLVLQTGGNLTLYCCGKQPIEWIVRRGSDTPEEGPVFDLGPYSDPFGRGKLPMVKVGQNVSNSGNVCSWSHVDRLDVSDLEYFYTGEYVCRYVDAPVISDAVYVYVSDAFNTFAVYPLGGFSQVPIYQYRQAILPCRTTHPNTSVELLNPMTGLNLLKGNLGMTFDPKVGFIVPFVTDIATFSGVFYCQALPQQKYLSLHFKPAMEMVLIPSVMSDSDTVLVGENINLTCTVSVSTQTQVLMKWSFRSTENITISNVENSNRYHIAKQNVEEKGNYREFSKKLQVKDAQLKDAVVYRCTVSTHGAEDFRETSIDVIDKSFVTLDPERKSLRIEENFRGEVLKIHYNAYPLPVFKWYHNDVLFGNDTFPNIKMQHDDVAAALIIRRPRKEQAGKYTLEAITRDMTTSASVEVIIEYAPEVKIESSNVDEYFVIDERHDIECVVKSEPPPTSIIWEWQPCYQPGNCSLVPRNWKMLNETAISHDTSFSLRKRDAAVDNLLLPHFEEFRSKGNNGSRVTVTAKQSGWFRCIGINKIGRANASFKFIASEVKNGFESWVNERRVIDGDNVTLSFKASIWRYWSLNVQNMTLGKTNITDVENTNRTTVTVDSNTLSVSVNIRINEVGRYDAGQYLCYGKNYSNDSEPHLLTLNVLPAMEMVLIPSVMSDSDTVLVGENINLTCTVSVSTQTQVLMKWSFRSTENITISNVENVTGYENSNRYHIAKQNVEEKGNYREFSKKLQVKDAQLKDAVVYRCTVSTRGAEDFRETSIDVIGATSCSNGQVHLEHFAYLLLFLRL